MQTFVDWTPKMVFDRLVQTSADGLFPSTKNSGSGCAYRAENGRKCPFGLFIPDELYNKNIEDVPAGMILNNDTMGIKVVLPPWSLVEDFWRRIQLVHDVFVFNNKRWNHEEFVKNLKCVFNGYCFKID